MEEENKDKSRKISSREGKVVEVPSRKIIIGGKVITFTKRSDITDILGEKLGSAETKDSLITAVRKNGEEAKEEGKDKKTKFKAKYLIPILLVLMIPLIARSCGQTDKTQDIQYTLKTVPIDAIVYNIDNPYPEIEALVNSAGQEGMTANLLEGDTFEGKHYSSNEQFQAESNAVSGVSEFEIMRAEIDSNMKILTAEESTQEQRYEAAKRLLELEQQAESIYKENESVAQEYAQRFKAASEAYRDSNTDKESMAIDIILEHYLSELGLSSANVAQLEEIVSLCEEGYELNISAAEQELDGDYKITGEAVKEVVVEQNIEQSKTIWQKFADFVRGRSDKGIEK